MKRMILATLISTLSVSAWALNPSKSEEAFCAARKDANFVKKLAYTETNTISFRNHGGLGNGGVCWWHSRLLRNALYLSIFKADLPKPSVEEAKDIIKQLRYAKNVVTIPGYSNFYDFTVDFEAQVQRELEKWQKGDGFIRMAWVKGLAGNSEVPAEEFKKLMDDIYHEVEENNNIAYNKLQIPGVDAHAWLVVNMKKLSNGYVLKVVDSNFPNEVETYEYREGDTSLDYHGYFKFVPYLERVDEMVQIKNVISNFCNK